MHQPNELIAQVEADIVESNKVLAELERAAAALEDLDLPVTAEMTELFEKMEALGESRSECSGALLQFGIRG